MFQKHKRPKTDKTLDFTLFATISLLTAFGAVMVYSGSVLVALKLGFEPQHYFIRQLIWIAIGLISGYIAFKIDYRILPKLAPYMLGFATLLLIVVLLLNWNDPIKRWIDFGFFDLQPSEIAKLCFLIYLSSWLAKRKEVSNITRENITKHLTKDLLPFLFSLFVVSILVLMEPDLDTTFILVATSLIVYFIAGNDLLHFIGSGSVLLMFIGVLTVAMKTASYRLERFTNWRDFWINSAIQDPYGAGYQLKQILVAVASGGILGVGFGNSRQKFHYLGDTAFSDTIFAIFAEEFGFIGSVLLVLAFFIILYRGYAIAKNAPDKLGYLLAISITTWITIQATLHIASNVALIPINGNTLPFISYGGSSTIINLTAIGLLLNISRTTSKEKIPRTTSRKKLKKHKTSILSKINPKNWISDIFN